MECFSDGTTVVIFALFGTEAILIFAMQINKEREVFDDYQKNFKEASYYTKEDWKAVNLPLPTAKGLVCLKSAKEV
ncbi:hypothetical protein [Bartonella birtlesii]|uniref:hypothetical protein n=1 Tax=Bartonella birtlesii TaxID=111504 RepID=UPI000378F2CE|nr:hypothetical protein [Bartonella birtlesii]